MTSVFPVFTTPARSRTRRASEAAPAGLLRAPPSRLCIAAGDAGAGGAAWACIAALAMAAAVAGAAAAARAADVATAVQALEGSADVVLHRAAGQAGPLTDALAAVAGMYSHFGSSGAPQSTLNLITWTATAPALEFVFPDAQCVAVATVVASADRSAWCARCSKT
jgi:hypothetical protein